MYERTRYVYAIVHSVHAHTRIVNWSYPGQIALLLLSFLFLERLSGDGKDRAALYIVG